MPRIAPDVIARSSTKDTADHGYFATAARCYTDAFAVHLGVYTALYEGTFLVDGAGHGEVEYALTKARHAGGGR